MNTGISETGGHGVQTDGGQDTTRGQRWSSKHPRRRQREEQAAKQVQAMERDATANALRHHADRNPGAVVEVGTDRMADLTTEPGHVQKVITDWCNSQKRVRVLYVQFGAASDVTEELDGERIPAGDLTPEDVHPSALGTHVEFIARERGERLDDHVERVEQYIRERWDPGWNSRERVSGQMGDADD